jgi:hypothetical protein
MFKFIFSNKCIVFFLGKKPLPYEKGGDFINGFHIIFSIFKNLVMFHDTQIGGLMVVEKM